MKRIYSILFASFFLLSWTSCSSYLEENPKDRLDEETAYSTLSDVQKNGVLSLYNYVGGYVDSQGLQGTGRGIYDLNTFTTDEAIMPTRGGDWYDGGFWQGLYLHRWGVNNEAIYATWEYLYRTVILCNGSLERIQDFALFQNKRQYILFLCVDKDLEVKRGIYKSILYSLNVLPLQF